MKMQGDGWVQEFRYNPLLSLLKSPDEAFSLFARRELLGESISVENLGEYSEPRRNLIILKIWFTITMYYIYHILT